MKRKIFALCALLILPAILLIGCDPAKTFTITTTSSNDEIGSGNGGSQFPVNNGTKVSLRAQEISGNPFICWVKNSTTVVSKEKEFTLTASQDTEGEYVAVFQENSPISMKYATLANITYDGEESYSSLAYTIEYAPVDNLGQRIVLCQGQQDKTDLNLVSENGVFFFERLTQTDLNQSSFSFFVQIVASTQDGSQQHNYTYSDILISNNSFGQEKTFEFKTTDSNFTLTFAKLTADLFEE